MKNFEKDVISYTIIIIINYFKAFKINRTLQNLSSEK